MITGTVSPAIFSWSRVFSIVYSALYSSAVLFEGRTTWNSPLCCNTTLVIRLSNLCLHINYSIQKRKFWEAKWVKERAKWANGNSKIGSYIIDLSSIKEKQNRQKKSRPTYILHIIIYFQASGRFLRGPEFSRDYIIDYLTNFIMHA